MQTTVI